MSGTAPLVGVIMGSRSDLPTLEPALAVLAEFGVPSETRIVSAHRTPQHMAEYAATARGRGIRVIIAAAGGSAHLPGMVASETSLPVLGVAVEHTPERTAAAVGSQIYMPKGKPLAFLGSGEAGAANAALFAVRLLAMGDDALAQAYDEYDARLTAQVLDTDRDVSGG